TIDIEVRYYETDGQGIVHHANYFQYFELARVQMLKAAGYDYADLGSDGFLLVVHKIGCPLLFAAQFGETVGIVTTMERATPARIDHSYKVYRDDILLAEGNSTLACVNRAGQVQRMPAMLYEGAEHSQPETTS